MNKTGGHRRVVVTGIGMVTPLGIGKRQFSERLFRGDSGIEAIAAFDTSRLSSHLGAEIKTFNPLDFLSAKNARRMDRLSRLTAASARLAVEDAQLIIHSQNRDRVGIIFGTAYGPTDLKIRCTEILLTEGPSRVNPTLVPNSVLNAPAGHASLELGFRGVNTTVTHQAASGETALVYAAMELHRGTMDVVLAGGADILSDFFFESLVRFRAVSPVDGQEEKARPFDVRRNGPVAGEGCGILCLESLEHAIKRGAIPYCEMTGWGMSSSPASPVGWPQNGKGIVLAMKRALRRARLRPSDIDAIQGAGNGGVLADAIETEALMDLFGPTSGGPTVSSVKGALGESFSSGGVRAAALALSIQAGKIPPTLGLEDPIVQFPFTMEQLKEMDIRHGLLNTVSSGGTNVSITMSRFE
ncbi:MAG: beta-ketoacyl-[acyl-carrier-protein] synthase family protein [Syntrophales bacterium]|jgi:3-oxoacyl-[acyl-carrier-protein] synthase II|nr:beta-ketoacyl-[acyl-carrier-protein] synthase family protein [Syntrophales bacterium]